MASAAMTPMAGRIGLWSLTHPALMEMWFKFHSLPWVPWLGLNNSVVHGSLLLGLASSIPIFILSKPLAIRISPLPKLSDVGRRLDGRRGLGTEFVDADFEHRPKPLVASAEPHLRATLPRPAKPVYDPPKSLALEPGATWPNESEVSDVDEQTCQELENLLTRCNDDATREVDVDGVVRRAAQMAHLVDNLLSSCQLDSTSVSTKPQRRDMPCDRPTTHLQFNQTLSGAERNLPKQAAEGALRSHGPSIEVMPIRKHPVGDAHQAETLRYLLHHLKAIKDKVSTNVDQ